MSGGNQHSSRKQRLLELLHDARASLRLTGAVGPWGIQHARDLLVKFWNAHRRAPASTRRRWRAGK